MRSRDLVMIVVSFLAMLAGSFLPGLAEPLAPFPRLCLIVLLYLGFFDNRDKCRRDTAGEMWV